MLRADEVEDHKTGDYPRKTGEIPHSPYHPGMWGNRFGWTLSLASVSMIVTFLVVLHAAADKAAPRTEFSQDSQYASAIELPVDPATVLAGAIEPRDASLVYRRAVEQAMFKPFVYEQFARAGQARDLEDVPAVKILLEATNASTAEFFSTIPSQLINYDNEKPMLDMLRTLGQCSVRAGMLIEDEQPAEAMKYYEAAFSLGAKLHRERLTWAEFDTGMTLMAASTRLLATSAEKLGKPDQASAARRFDAARVAYVSQHIQPMQRILSSPDARVIERHVGDVIHFSRHAGERMWRIEATLRLGRYRFHSERLGDQRVASRVIQDLTKDPDPYVRLAAEAARDLTIEKYRMIR